jgi:hypothetical protein
MKAVLFLILILALFNCSLSDFDSDCTEIATNECIKKIPAGFNFLKGYPVTFDGKEYVEYSYVLTSGTNYILKLCKQQGSDVKLIIMDGSRNVVGSNFVDGTLLSVISYPCRATSIYYIRILAGEPGFCGSCLLAFNRK